MCIFIQNKEIVLSARNFIIGGTIFKVLKWFSFSL